MGMDRSFYHLFNTPGGHYIFDVNTNRIIKTDEQVSEYLNQRICDPSIHPEVNDAVQKMRDRGFLSSKRVKKISHWADNLLEYRYENKLFLIALQVTQQCNLRCSYCIYSGGYSNRTHSNKSMSFDTAKTAIDFYISHSKDADKISVGFYGGEPLRELELIKKCVEYTLKAAEGKDVLFDMTTNGTLLNEEAMDFIVKHEIKLLISLDGPREIHDRNRMFAGSSGGTFNQIMENIQLFHSKYPEYVEQKVAFSVVIDPKNSFNCINQFFVDFETIRAEYNNYSYIADQYAENPLELPENHFAESGYEWFKLFLHKIGRLDGKYVSPILEKQFTDMKETMVDKRICIHELPDVAQHSGPCIPGEQRLMVDVEGNLYPCERVSETSQSMRIGTVHTGFDIEKCRKLLNVGKLTEENCKNCWAFFYCSLCAAFADDMENLTAERKARECPRVREETEELLKDFCMLKEFGVKFEREDNLLIDLLNLV